MMNLKSIFIILFFLSVTSNLFAADTLAIHDAILKRRIAVTALGNGGLGENSARIILKNNISADLNIMVPAGLMLNSEDEGAQDLIILEESILFVKGRGISGYDMYGACTQLTNYAPKREEKYKLGQLAQEELRQIAQIISDNKLQSSIGQGAIWAFTDNSDINNVFHPDYVDASWDMAKIIATFRKDNPPTREEIMEAPRPASRIVFSARADVIYHAPRDIKANLAIYDSANNLISQKFPSKNIFGGLHIYTIGINNILSEETTFYARLKDEEGNVLAEAELANNQPYEQVVSKLQKIRFEYIVRKPSKISMSMYDMDENLIQVLSTDRKQPLSKLTMNLEFFHARPKGTELQIKVTNSEGEVIHIEKVIAN
ncbi:MAG: hypothetical protein JXR07_15405 [Reichenbachiella sp.]